MWYQLLEGNDDVTGSSSETGHFIRLERKHHAIITQAQWRQVPLTCFVTVIVNDDIVLTYLLTVNSPVCTWPYHPGMTGPSTNRSHFRLIKSRLIDRRCNNSTTCLSLTLSSVKIIIKNRIHTIRKLTRLIYHTSVMMLPQKYKNPSLFTGSP